jgi:hypothetical protein
VHCSCAGRGQQEQEELFLKKATRAHWKESAHNYNVAMDLFELRNGQYTLDHQWFLKVVNPTLGDWQDWYGRPNAPFWELPHVEVKDWHLVKEILTLVS